MCKIGTGFSEEALQSHYETLKPLELTKVRGDVKVGGAKPDVWFEPKIVWEVLTADLSLSPVYTAAQGLVCCYFFGLPGFLIVGKVEDRGISLRFPRFVRIRDDKAADDATGPEQVMLAQLPYRFCHRLIILVCRWLKCMKIKLSHRVRGRKKARAMLTMDFGDLRDVNILHIICFCVLLRRHSNTQSWPSHS